MRRLRDFLVTLWLAKRFGGCFLAGLWAVVWFLLRFIGTSIIIFWAGVFARIALLAREWEAQAYELGAPREWSSFVYVGLYALAFASTLIGWILCSYLTMWLVHRVF